MTELEILKRKCLDKHGDPKDGVTHGEMERIQRLENQQRAVKAKQERLKNSIQEVEGNKMQFTRTEDLPDVVIDGVTIKSMKGTVSGQVSPDSAYTVTPSYMISAHIDDSNIAYYYDTREYSHEKALADFKVKVEI